MFIIIIIIFIVITIFNLLLFLKRPGDEAGCLLISESDNFLSP